jgi:hypothetical protein
VQLARLTDIGDERTANAGGVLHRAADCERPVVALVEGDAAA